jgi:hypothetical protein
MRYAALIVTTQILSACASDPLCPDYSDVSPGFYGGDGSSKEQAVEIVGYEYSYRRWLEEQHPGSRETLQELVISPDTGQPYDRIVFVTASGDEREAWFLVTGGVWCL